MDLAHLAAQDHPAGSAHAGRRRLIDRQRANGRDGLMPIEAAAPRVEAELFDAAQLVGTTGFNAFHGYLAFLLENSRRGVPVRQWILVCGQTVSIAERSRG